MEEVALVGQDDRLRPLLPLDDRSFERVLPQGHHVKQ